MANIKFFRKDVAPSNPQEGYVWFNSSNNTIQLYKNNAWEIYTGKINDVTYTDGVLTIIPHTGNSVSVNLGNVANIEGLANRLSTLETNFNTLSGDFNTEKGKISTLQGEMATVKTEVAKLEGITDKVTTYVVTKIGEEEKIRKAADDAFEGRISGLETTTGQHTESINSLKGLVGEDAVATQITNAINALNNEATGTGSYVDVTVTQVDGKVTTVAVADGDLTTAFNDVNKTISDEVTRATTKEGELAGAINTEKDRIDALIGDGDGSVKKIAYNVLAEELLAGPDGAVDNFTTLQQVAAWIEQHPEDAAAMNEAISGLQTWRSGLNTTDTAVSNQYVSKIDQVDGKIVITRASLPTIPDVTAAINALDATVKDETDYIKGSITQTNGKLTGVSFTATTGAVANNDNALAVASDVKGYVDSAVNSAWTWGEF